jgi:hypothetical protein
MAGDVARAAASLIPGATLAMRLAGKIKSPSQLTRDEVGVPLGQGIVAGLEIGLSPIAQNAISVLDAATTTITTNGRAPWATAGHALADALNDGCRLVARQARGDDAERSVGGADAGVAGGVE